MSALADVQDFLAQKRLAIVGVSRQPKDFSRMLYREFIKNGYEVVAVNPQAAEVEGQPCFPNLQAVQPPVDTVLLMTSPTVTEETVHDCAQLGVRRVWMYRAGGAGAVSDRAVEFCRSNGIAVVPGECPMMFLKQSPWFHQIHAWIKKIGGSYPR